MAKAGKVPSESAVNINRKSIIGRVRYDYGRQRCNASVWREPEAESETAASVDMVLMMCRRQGRISR